MRGRPAEFRGFLGGLNLVAGPRELSPAESPNLLNVTPNQQGSEGSIASRFGDVAKWSVAHAAAVDSIHGFIHTDGKEVVLLGVVDDIYRSVDGGAPALVTSVAGRAPWWFVQAVRVAGSGQGPLYGVNGGGTAKAIFTDGSVVDWTASSGTLPNRATMLLYIGNRVWAAGMDTYGSLDDPLSALLFSDLGAPRAWPAANVVVFNPGDGEQIMGIGTLNSNIVVAKRTRCWLVYDLDTGANRPLGSSGCVAPRSMVETPYGLVWLGPEGVMLTTGGDPRPISDKIKPLLDSAEARGVSGDAAAAFVDDRYYLALNYPVDPGGDVVLGSPADPAPPGALPGLLLEYDFSTESWWRHGTLSPIIGAVPVAAVNDLRYVLYGGRTDDIAVDHLLTDESLVLADGSSLSERYRTPYLPLAPTKARVNALTVHGEGQVAVSVAKDYSDSFTTQIAGSSFPADGELRTMDLGMARSLALLFANSSTTERMVIDDFGIWAKARRD